MNELPGQGRFGFASPSETQASPKDEIARLGKPFLLFDPRKTIHSTSAVGYDMYSSRVILIDPKTKLRLTFSVDAAFDADEQPDLLGLTETSIVLRAEGLENQPLPALSIVLKMLQFQTRLLKERNFSEPVGIDEDKENDGSLEFVFDIEGINRVQLYTLRGLFTLK